MCRFHLVWLLILLSACAGTPQERGSVAIGYAKFMIKRGDYDGAFSLMRDYLRSTAPGDREYQAEAIALLQDHPAVIAAAKAQLSVEGYLKTMDSLGEPATRSLAAEQLEALSLVIPRHEADEIGERLAELARKGEVVYVGEPIFTRLTSDELMQLEANRFVRKVARRDAGIVIERQSVNDSTPGSSAGTQLGAAVGSAAYVDKAFAGSPSNWNYSAKGHLGAELIGGLIGSAIGDRAPATQYRFRYALRLLDRSIVYRDVVVSAPLGHSSGVCVSVADLEQLPQEVCEFDLDAFRAKYLSK